MNTENATELDLKSLAQTAAEKHQQGELQAAESIYRRVFSTQSHRLVGVQEGLENVYHLVLVDFATVLGKQGKLAEAIKLYQQALSIKPDWPELHFFLIDVLQQQGKLEAAVESCQQLLHLYPNFAEAHFLLGSILKQQGKLDEAVRSYQQALQHKPDFPEAYNNLGTLFKQQGKLDKAVGCYQQALKLKPDHIEAYYNLGNLFKQQGKLEKAIQFYQQALDLKPRFLEGYVSLGSAFRRQGKVEEAVQFYQKALQINSNSAEAQLGFCIGRLPIIYTDVEEIQRRRERYQNALQSLAQYYQNATPKQQAMAASAVGTLQPFFLAYQGLNDRPLQQIYGQLMHQLMSCRYPQFTESISNLKLAENEKIRVGFVSGFFQGHSNWKIPIKGWVENLDPEKFELFGYHTSLKKDRYTEEAAQAFIKFVQAPLTFKQWCETIQQDRLHVLIFPEFGMDAVTLQLGCLRLAPIQMTSWGHPETSGLPTIDYYLSSELMEPENAQEHYTEKLVRLPNLSIHYTPLEIPFKSRSKSEIGLQENEIMFWCCQSLYKYLPQHDDVFPRIAQQLKTCKFVFIKYHGDASERVTEVFSQRLRHAFEEWGLNYQDYCIFLPRLKSSLFAGTSALADVFLDTMGWSGCNSSLEAITYNIPLVTLPGELMRGRHTLAFLKMMGIEETIATSKEDYINIAVRLGQDAEYRQHIRQKIANNKHKIYGDLEAIKGLENLLINLVYHQDFSLNSIL